MPLQLQSKLLRALQEKKIRRLGGSKNIPLDIRIIAASNQNLNQAIDEGKFRSDLYYRLAVFIIKIPPLRNNPQDIEKYVKYFIEEYETAKNSKYIFTDEARNALQNYNWPGNVRQLRNAVEYICQVCDSCQITLKDLPSYVIGRQDDNNNKSKSRNYCEGRTLAENLDNMEAEILRHMMEKYGPDLAAKKVIAAELGVSIATLYNKLHKHGLNGN